MMSTSGEPFPSITTGPSAVMAMSQPMTVQKGNAAWAWSPQLGIELIPGPSTISQLALFSDTDNVSGQCILVFSQPALAV